MRLYVRVKGGKYHWEETINGRRYRSSTHCRDRKLAKNIAVKEIGLILEGKHFPKAKSVTVNELLDGLKKHYELIGKASSQNLSLVKRTKAAFGSKMADELTKADIGTYMEKRAEEGYAPSSTNRILECLRRSYRLAELAPPRVVRLEENNVRQGFLSRQQFDNLLLHLPDYLKDFSVWGYLTGMRCSEIRSLSWTDVDGNTVRLLGEHAKTRKPRSIVAAGELEALLARRRAARAVKNADGTALAEYIFHCDGTRIGEFRKSWRTACRKAGVPGTVFHDLRRSAVRNLVRAGVSEHVAMQISGHRTRSTFDRYDIVAEEDLRDAMVRLESQQKATAR